ncbi:MAG: ArdC-like ssDNA-binding domain-containing protein [Symbiobacteriaceae bacterium]|nr:ArdC-like ssDNA-binding domain-containing protein [Symbiobacteriaceae bacterium]
MSKPDSTELQRERTSPASHEPEGPATHSSTSAHDTPPPVTTRDLLLASEDEIDGLLPNDKYGTFLRVMSRNSYSYRNCLLICRQMPDASQLASYDAWTRLGRQVLQGETGIHVLAPVTFTNTTVSDSADDDLITQQRTRFKPWVVFDVSQTYGEKSPPSPLIIYRRNVDSFLSAMRKSSPMEIRYTSRDPSSDRDALIDLDATLIYVNADLKPFDEMFTLIDTISQATVLSYHL